MLQSLPAWEAGIEICKFLNQFLIHKRSPPAWEAGIEINPCTREPRQRSSPPAWEAGIEISSRRGEGTR